MKYPVLAAALAAFVMAHFLQCATVPQPRSETETNAENRIGAIIEPQTSRLTLDHSQILPEVHRSRD